MSTSVSVIPYDSHDDKKGPPTIRLEVDREHAELIIDTPNEKVNKLTRSAFMELRDCLGLLRSKSEQIKTLIM